MELSPKQQVTELVRKFNNVLIVTHARPDGDAVGSALAMHLVLEQLGKHPTTVIRDAVPEMYAFLPALDKVTKDLTGSRDLVVSVNTSKTKVDKLKYNTSEDRLNVVISPKEGQFADKDVEVRQGAYSFDLVIVLDAPDLDRLGSLYEDNPDLFYEAPVVNIDHHPSNDYFGAVNLVDLTATSTSEILVGVIEALGESLMTEDVATLLLTGLITDTGSFQNANTTPKSLTVSAQLVAQGGRQQEIIQHVYKTKPLSTLRLWGRALTRLQYDPTTRVVWASLTNADFTETGGTPTEAKGVIDSLMSSAPDAEIILLLREREDGRVDGSVRTTKGVDATKVVGFWNGGGHKGAAGFDTDGPLENAERNVVLQIKKWQAQRLGVPGPTENTSSGRSATAGLPPRPAEQVPTRPTRSVPSGSGTTREQGRPGKSRQPKRPAGQRPPQPRNPRRPDGMVSGGVTGQVSNKPHRSDQQPQQPLSDDELDAYFKKSGANGQVIDQRPKNDRQS
ncbi:MAG TPA: bifunctional oligoribonuclease/PAP phosphatase NrnA [Patescibacteria group bacterium]|jgi:phosphoesterase RecJ-like protein